MTLQLLDLFETTLSAGYTAGATTLPLTSVAGLPASGDYWLSVYDPASVATTYEVFKVTGAASAGAVPVTGGQSGTTAKNHSSGHTAYASVLTAAALTQLKLDAQTPWTSDIDGANNSLKNVFGVAVGTSAASFGFYCTSSGPSPAFNHVNSGTGGYAGVSLQNDLGHALSLRSNGSARTLADLAQIDTISPLVFTISSVEKMRLTGAGLGIGVSPVYKLDVSGDCNVTGVYRINGTPLVAGVSSVFTRTGAVIAASGDYTAAQVTNAADMTASYANPAWITSLAWAKITGAPATGVSSVFGRSGAVVAASGDYTAAQVTSAVSSAGSYADPAWITALGWGKITGAPSVGSYQTPWLQDISAAGFRLLNTGNVGIGTASPQTKLNIVDAVNDTAGSLRLDATYASVGDYCALGWGTPGAATPVSGIVQRVSAGGQMAFDFRLQNASSATLATAANVMTMLGSGFVGIGTASPGNILEVKHTSYVDAPFFTVGTNNAGSFVFVGTQKASGRSGSLTFFDNTDGVSGSLGLQVYGDSGGAGLFVKKGGNVGIGTASSGAPLTVAGPANNDALRISPSSDLNRWLVFKPESPTNGVTIVYWTGTTSGLITLQGPIAMATLPTANPGAGTKQLWADPADSYRVKWAN